MLGTRLAPIVAVLLASLFLSTTFAFGAINLLPSAIRRRHRKKNNRIKIMGQAQSSPELHAVGNNAATADGDNSSGNGQHHHLDTTPTATPSNRDDSTAVSDRGPLSEAIIASQQQRQRQQQHQSPYTPPSSPIEPLAHYIFLVHGWLGNDLEMGYLTTALNNVLHPSSEITTTAAEGGISSSSSEHSVEVTLPSSSSAAAAGSSSSSSSSGGGGGASAKRAKRSGSRLTQQLLAAELTDAENNGTSERDQNNHGGGNNSKDAPEIVVHSVKCNIGKTHDGIRNGGTRLANEMMHFIRADVEKRLKTNPGEEEEEATADVVEHVTYSIVGNSLGGLYARYAISLLPYQLRLYQQQNHNNNHNNNNNNNHNNNNKNTTLLHLHPNIFCTTATPHLGVSRHTYLPLPRIAETIIGTGMGATGRDLFRLNSEKDLASAAAGGLVGAAVGGVSAAVGGVRRLTSGYGGGSAAARDKNVGDVGAEMDNGDATNNGNGATNAEIRRVVDEEEELQCIIHRMCLQEKYLTPLRNFRRRIAYANAYGTDFQVPTETAAFLNEKSGVGHFVMASRDPTSIVQNGVGRGEGSVDNQGSGEKRNTGNVGDGDERTTPPFIVAVVRTEKQPRPQSPTGSKGTVAADDTLSDELLRMSQSLDALGWTKVFIDVRNRIPVRGLAKPAWLRPQCGSLDDLIRERVGLTFTSLERHDADDTNNNNNGKFGEFGALNNEQHDDAMEESPKKSIATTVETTAATDDEEKCILTSQELAQSTKHGDSINFPLGHTVMVANSKSEGYSKLNIQGRPVMDRLAEDLVDDVLEFE